MTPQEAFDKAVCGVIAQGGPCIDRGGSAVSCRYRLGDRKCAAGHLIPDDEYSPDMENREISDVMDQHPIHLPRKLVNDLQYVHDSLSTKDDTMFMPAFVVAAGKVALSYGLSRATVTAAFDAWARGES